MRRAIHLELLGVIAILFALTPYALADGDPAAPLVVKGMIHMSDGTPVANKTVVVAKVDSQGREVILMRGDQPLPPVGQAKTNGKGGFTINLSKNEFGGSSIRFCLKVIDVFEKGDAFHVRGTEGLPYIVDVDFFTDSVDLTKKGLIIASR